MKARRKMHDLSFRTFLLHYCIIAATVLTAFLPVYFQTIRSVREAALNDGQKALENKMQILDRDFIYLNHAAAALRNNENVAALARAGAGSSHKDYYKLFLAQKYMQAAILPTALAEELYFVCNKSPILISRGILSADIATVYPSMFSFSGMDRASWQAAIRPDDMTPYFIPAQRMSLQRGIVWEEKEVLTYVVPAANLVSMRCDSALLCFFSVEQLKNLLFDGGIFAQGSLEIMGKEGETLCSWEAASVPEGDIKKLSIKSTVSGLEIVSYLPSAAFSAQIEVTLRYIRRFFILSITAGCILSLLLAYRNNLPVRRLRRTLMALPQQNSREMGFFERMEDLLMAYRKLDEQYRSRVAQLEGTIRTNLFDKLILGQELLPEEEARIALDFPFLQYPFLVAVIQFMGEPVQPQKEPASYYPLMSLIVSDLAKGKLDSILFLHNIIHKKLVLLLRVKGGGEGGLQRGLNELSDEIKQRTGETVVIGLSSTASGANALSICYKQAWNAIRLCRPEDAGVFSYQELGGSGNAGRKCVGLHDLQVLYELLRAGDYNRVCVCIDRISRSFLEGEAILSDRISGIYHSIFNMILFAAKDCVSSSVAFLEKYQYSEEVSINGLFENLKAAANELCSLENRQKRSKNEKLLQTLKAYVAQNYSNPNLSAALAAEDCRVSEKYLYNFIKGQTGKSFGEYVEDTRLSAACSLLEGSSLTVGEIAQRTGFYSQNTFYKAFKRTFGVSPGEWRKTRRRKDAEEDAGTTKVDKTGS